MKTLEKMERIVYRFRCSRCKSRFEMTEDERRENDWTCGEYKKGGTHDYPHNPLNYFECPVCNAKRLMDPTSIHKYFIMTNGHETMDY